MGAGHAHPLYLPDHSPVHRLPAEVKIVAALLGAICVVATPREAFGMFAGHLAVLAVVWGIARIPPGWILRRAVIELPFVVLAVLLPVTGPDPRIDVLGVALSEPGLLGAWNIVVKGTLGRADLAHPGGHHPAARPAPRACSGCTPPRSS